MTIMERIIGHARTVLRHKYYVWLNCCKAGIPWRGLKHDLSKFSPVEFIESVEYYQGDRSPIDACKELNGVSYAWMHHKGRNSHHYEYWVDYLDQGGKAQIMPYKDVLEMMCDFLGAGMAYSKNSGKPFSYDAEYDWWKAKLKTNPKMHYKTVYFCEAMFYTMKKEGTNDCLIPRRSKFIYKASSQSTRYARRHKS